MTCIVGFALIEKKQSSFTFRHGYYQIWNFWICENKDKPLYNTIYSSLSGVTVEKHIGCYIIALVVSFCS